jgi:uncharacterized protein
MKERPFDPVRLDVQRFARDAAELAGAWPMAGFARLVESAIADDGVPGLVDWRARGEWRTPRGHEPQPWLHLEASARLALQCQRCLQPVEVGLQAQRSFRFVAGEEAAAELDPDAEEDVLALPRALDLHELVEDELLLALPLVPRHDRCPLAVPMTFGDDPAASVEDRPNPFEALKALKRGGQA